MDNQRTLFKKFFNNNNASQPTPNSGFNPPKFQFNKKKLGLGGFGSSAPEEKGNKKEEAKTVKEIDSVEIESDEYQNNSDSESSTNASTATWNTLNTLGTAGTLNTVKITSNVTNVDTLNTVNTVNKSENINRPEIIVAQPPHNLKAQNNYSQMYSEQLEKNKQKYTLSDQLEEFSMRLEEMQRAADEKRNALDLLLLSVDEKMGKN